MRAFPFFVSRFAFVVANRPAISYLDAGYFFTTEVMIKSSALAKLSPVEIVATLPTIIQPQKGYINERIEKMNIVCLLPSNRPHLLEPLLASMAAMATKKNWQAIIGVDKGDKAINALCKRFGAIAVELPPEVYVIPNYDGDDGFNQTMATNVLSHIVEWDFAWVLNDDCVITKPGWDIVSQTVMPGYLGYTTSPPTPWYFSDFPVFTKAHYRAHKHIWPEAFGGWGADRWMNYAYTTVRKEQHVDMVLKHSQCDKPRFEKIMAAWDTVYIQRPDVPTYMAAIAAAAAAMS